LPVTAPEIDPADLGVELTPVPETT
jgi:hypothetical protein